MENCSNRTSKFFCRAEVGIKVNSPLNIEPVKTSVHRRLHTNLYYGWANRMVISAYNSANGDSAKQRINVIAALEQIRTFVRSLNAIAPY